MQTFLPSRHFWRSAQLLDNRRLGKQRVEALQVAYTLLDPSYGWQRHPAVNMWRGHTKALLDYGVEICREWRHRRFKDTCLEKIQALRRACPDTGAPGWLGNAAFHASHRANLLRKDPAFYCKYGWHEDPAMPYVWPAGQDSARWHGSASRAPK